MKSPSEEKTPDSHCGWYIIRVRVRAKHCAGDDYDSLRLINRHYRRLLRFDRPAFPLTGSMATTWSRSH